jgi:hypothetical protein
MEPDRSLAPLKLTDPAWYFSKTPPGPNDTELIVSRGPPPEAALE